MVLRFFLFASLFLFASCTDVKYDNPDDPKSPDYIGNRISSSSSVKRSSSSGVVSSSSSMPSSSSSVPPSSSSSSAVVSSSSSKPSSSSSAPPSSSSLAQSSSSAVVYSPSSPSIVPSSSSAMPSSSSVVVSSSSSVVIGIESCDGFVDGTPRDHYGRSKAQFCDSRDGKKYVYVEIGTQTWMAENLNYNAGGSKCNNNSEANCTTYGRLYDWATAMALPSESDCNYISCASQVSAKHQGVCPSGWHIPSDAEWTTLRNFAGGTSAGTALKATSGWDHSGNGTDVYGFSALPGSSGFYNGTFSTVGWGGGWWTTTETTAGCAISKFMTYSSADISNSNCKTQLFSVRCVQD